MTEKKFQFSINEGDAFYAHETSIQFGPMQFVLDFKSVTPRIDMRCTESPILALKHNVILLEPHGTKMLTDALTKMIKRYEEKFGKIEKPAAMKKFEQSEKRKAGKKEVESEPATYFG